MGHIFFRHVRNYGSKFFTKMVRPSLYLKKVFFEFSGLIKDDGFIVET